MDEKPSFYAVIPASVRYDKRLKPCARLLYGEITALSNEKGYCWATNAYFAKLYDVGPGTISAWIAQLSQYGYIRIEITYKQGTREIEHRYCHISGEGIAKKEDRGIAKNRKGITTEFFNITSNKERESASALVPVQIEKPTEKPETEEPTASCQPLDSEKKDSRPPRAKPEKKIHGEFANVHLTEAEYENLLTDYGHLQTEAIVQKLSAYKAEKGKAYKSDMAAIRTWVLSSLGSKKLPPPPPRCPLCGKILVDSICQNALCPQYEDGYKEGQK